MARQSTVFLPESRPSPRVAGCCIGGEVGVGSNADSYERRKPGIPRTLVCRWNCCRKTGRGAWLEPRAHWLPCFLSTFPVDLGSFPRLAPCSRRARHGRLPLSQRSFCFTIGEARAARSLQYGSGNAHKSRRIPARTREA